MDKEAALHLIRTYAVQGRIFIERLHAEPAMRKRHVSFDDVRHVLSNAASCSPTDKGRWKVCGVDLDRDELTVVVAIQSGLLVITVF